MTKTIVYPLLTITLLLGVSSSEAQRRRPPRDNRIPIADTPTVMDRENPDTDFEGGRKHLIRSCRNTLRLLRALNLTQEQAEAVKEAITLLYREVSATADERARAWKALFLVIHQPLGEGEEFDEQEVRDAYEVLSELREEVVVAYAKFVVTLQRILDDKQYRMFVRARIHFIRCTHAPADLFRRFLRAWIDEDE